LDKLDLDPGELAEVEDRLNVINRVVNKHGPTVEATLEHRNELAEKIAELEKATVDLASLRKEIDPLTKLVREIGSELTGKRQKAAAKLTPMVEKALVQLGMQTAKFTIEFAATDAGPGGFDMVEFIARTNPGLTAQPLRKIVSGGELSRIMLALKGILAQSDRISVLVFDEIDANVGGRLGSVIGNKLRDLAEHHQVLCITHLPQIASYADRHLTVRKSVNGDLTETRVREMHGDERLAELSEMIGGQRVTEVTRAQAKELLEAANPRMQVLKGTRAKNAKVAKNAKKIHF
jgi:DNA repair protein RecN (Recombination protein N)